MVIYAPIIHLFMIINFFIVSRFLSELLESKYEKNKQAAVYAVSETLFINLFYYNTSLDTYKTFVMLVFDLLVIILCYKDSIKKKVTAYIELNLVVLLTELIMICLMKLTGWIDFNEVHFYGRDKLITTITGLIVQCIGFLVILRLNKKTLYILSYDKIIKIYLCLLTQLITCIALFYYITEFYDLLVLYIMSFAIPLSLVADIYVIKMMNQMELKKLTENKMVKLMNQSIIESEYYEKICDSVEHLTELRNSYSENLDEIYRLLDKKRDNQVILDNIESSIITDNKIINQILANVRHELEAINCKCNIVVDVNEIGDIKVIDLSSILINMTDNAIEEVKKMNKKELKKAYVDIKLLCKDNEFNIVVENSRSANSRIIEVDQGYVTSKKDKSAHGYGLGLISGIALKYGGSMKIEYDKRWFRNTVIIIVKDTIVLKR